MKELEWLVKSEGEAGSYGSLPKDRPIERYIDNGIVNIDKPRGPTSHNVVDWVKKILNLKKAGHGGTLDPAVTGVLPACLGNATKVVQALLYSGKEYVCLMRLHKDVEQEETKSVFKKFVGEIYQKPPLKAAVVRKLRIREIYYLNIIEIDGKEVLFKVGCEAGTYIRKLCHDMGLLLGGAHMSELRRTKSGPFDETTLVTLIELKDAYSFWKEEKEEKYLRKFIQPVESALPHLPKVVIDDAAVHPVCNGFPLAVPGILKLQSGIEPEDLVPILTQKGELVALGKSKMSSKQILDSKKGIAIKIDRVIMPLGTYPKIK